jgi:heterodisulfide reductase subunit A
MLTLSKTADGFLMESHPKLKPIDAPTRGVFFAGFCEAPKDIKDSVCQAGAAASRAGALLNAGQIQIEAITSQIDQEACKKCGLCAAVCPYGAILWKKGEPAVVVEAACAGCGACGATCQFGAITMRHFTDDQYLAQVRAVLAERPQDKVFAFACNWCSYAGGDMAGISRIPYPATNRVVRTMCSARVSEEMVLEAFRCGAPVVLVSGCHYADCHYINANRQTVKRVQGLWDKLEKAGVRPERLQLEWISAAEGQKFAEVMQRIEELRKTVTAEEIEHTRETLKPKPKKAAQAGAAALAG